MKKLLFLLVVCSLLSTGCHHRVKGDAFEINTVTVEDSVQFPPEAMEEWMYDDKAYYLTVVDEPVTNNEDLRDNIIAWISSFLSENYDGDSQDVTAMVNYEKDEFLDTVNGSPQSSLQHFITLDEDNDRYVTYLSENYLYTGGIHGTISKIGATFSKKTGEQFGYQMFVNLDGVSDIIRNAVKQQYFEPLLEGTDAVFEETLFSDAAESFPMPVTEPWIQNDSVFFIYESYEIAPYAFGMPECGLPFLSLKDHLTEAGKAFFQIKQ